MLGIGVITLPVAQAVTSKAASRPDLNDVLHDYQASDDKMKNWRPSAWGVIPIPFQDSVKLTRTEGSLLDNLTQDRGLVGLSDFKDIRDDAFSETRSRYPEPSSIPGYVGNKNAWVNNDGHRDAFRHAYWNARLTKDFGETWAQAFTTAHEGVPGNPGTREAMDLYNNEVGRKIAVENPHASDKQLAELVQKAVSDGKMVVVDGAGNLAWSDQVAYGQHGVATDRPAPAAIGIPDDSVSPN